MQFLLRFVFSFWRLLPRNGRRRLFIRLTRLAVPRRGTATARLPVVVAGMLSSATGLGESARMNVDGVRRAGLPFATVDISGFPMTPADLPPYAVSGQVSPTGPGSLILHVSGQIIPLALFCCGRKVVRDKRLIGFLHWELPRLPADWRVGLDYLDEIWVPSRFCAEAVRRDFSRPVSIILHPVEVDGVRKRPASDGVFTALSMFNMASGFERKNPLAAVRAFKQAFGDDPATRLVVKIVNVDHYPAGMEQLRAAIGDQANITLVTEVLSRPAVLNLIAGSDAVLSLHRAEGFGLLAAEAMLIGVPVIATDWSATAEFLTAETGCPVPYRLIPAVDPQGASHFPDQLWADPDVDAAAAALVRLRRDPGFAQALADRGRAAAATLFSAERYAELIRKALS